MSAFLIEKGLISDRTLCFGKEEYRNELLRREKEIEEAKAVREAYEKEVIAKGGTVPVVNLITTEDLPPAAKLYSCTITIRCDTILDNMSLLSPGKEACVPSNGVILATTHVSFAEGENVFDVLKRVCIYAGIPIKYSWTVSFGGYYVEGINNLGEFDCGSESGWMYKVNGWFPNYGSYHYQLRDGDDIVWAYTVHGLGADLGAVYGE